MFYVAAKGTILGETWLKVSLPLYVCTYFFHQDHHLKRWLDGLQCSVSWRELYPDIPIPIRPSRTAMRGIVGPSRLCSTVWAAWVWKRKQGSPPRWPRHPAPGQIIIGRDSVSAEFLLALAALESIKRWLVTHLSHPSNYLAIGEELYYNLHFKVAISFDTSHK